MLLYDTLSEQKKELPKPPSGDIKLFVCGPTVYGDIHIGNARTYLVFDTLVHYLRATGHKIFYLQNITDIDDKIINRSKEAGLTPKALAKKYTRIYHRDEKKLGINMVTKYAPATEYIKQIINQVKNLIDKGYAYKLDDGYYFDISKFKEYGKLAKRTALQAEDGVSHIDDHVAKRNKGDFVLWKFSKSGEPSWKTHLGDGRPGWHIEDTAITEHHFGPQYDWHGGGVDIKFPHHEAEITQQESASGKKPLVRLWTHVGSLVVDGKKMSKSLGNIIMAHDFLEKHDARILRYIVLSHHYRSPLNYSKGLVVEAIKSLARIEEFLAKISLVIKNSGDVRFDVKPYEEKFVSAMNDDFNTPEALAAIFILINDANQNIWRFDRGSAENIGKWVFDKAAMLKLSLNVAKIPFKIRRLAKKRELFRHNEQFVQSDLLRKQIEQLGYTVEDTPLGQLVLLAVPKD